MSSTPVGCRSCGSTALLPVRKLARAPLDVLFCPACSLVQLPASASSDPNAEAGASFWSQSEAMQRHAQGLAAQVIQARQLGPDSLVIEAGSNDGWLLRQYREAGVPVLGIEPERETARVARQRHGIPTRETPFSRPLADKLAAQGLHADVFHAHCVLHRVGDINSFVRGIRRVLKPDGLAVIETPYVKDQLDQNSFEAITPEHQFCFSMTALSYCVLGHGLIVVDVERVAVAGGLLRLYVALARPSVWPGERVGALQVEEESWGVRSFESYALPVRKVA